MGLCIKLNMKYVMTGVIDINDISRTWFKTVFIQISSKTLFTFCNRQISRIEQQEKTYFYFQRSKMSADTTSLAWVKNHNSYF